MSSRSSARLSCLLGSFACLALHSASTASACDTDEPARWVPERAWPSACEPNALTDGLVLLEGDRLPAGYGGGEGELHVVIERMVQGQVAETFPGRVTRTDSTSALFKSDRPLPAHADFQVSAQREAADGSTLSAKFTSAFSTGEGSLPPLAFVGDPSLKLEQAEQEQFDCSKDACGDETCKSTGELALVKSLRIAVPVIQGGVDLRSYAVSARLVAGAPNAQAPVVATSDTTDTQPGKRSFLVLDIPALEYASLGCVTITATDVAGHTVSSAPVCLALPADVSAAFGSGVRLLNRDDNQVAQSEASAQEKADLDPSEYGTSTDAVSETPASVTGAQGCSVASDARGGAGTLGWLALALTSVRLRSRRTREHAHS